MDFSPFQLKKWRKVHYYVRNSLLAIRYSTSADPQPWVLDFSASSTFTKLQHIMCMPFNFNMLFNCHLHGLFLKKTGPFFGIVF